jgi:hypothetical protein
MRMPPLAAWNVEDARARRKAEDVDQARDLAAIALDGEERLVLEQILIVEVRLPPLGALFSGAQKKTGSR